MKTGYSPVIDSDFIIFSLSPLLDVVRVNGQTRIASILDGLPTYVCMYICMYSLDTDFPSEGVLPYVPRVHANKSEVHARLYLFSSYVLGLSDILHYNRGIPTRSDHVCTPLKQLLFLHVLLPTLESIASGRQAGGHRLGGMRQPWNVCKRTSPFTERYEPTGAEPISD